MTERAETIKHSSEHGKIATLKMSNIFHKIRTIKPKGNVARRGALGTRHCLPIQHFLHKPILHVYMTIIHISG